MLVTLTEQPIPETLLEPHGLKSLYFPIVDMNVPKLPRDRGSLLAGRAGPRAR
jgi:hypothetical protein